MALTFTVTQFVGITGSSCVSGSVLGAFSGSACGFTGSLTDFTGTLTGHISGSYSVETNKYVNEYKNFIKRSLIKFDLSQISKSIASGDIADPKFTLNLKAVESKELPLEYKIYAFPISQSWIMGTGLFAGNGSNDGVSWLFRNSQDTSTAWNPNIDGDLNISGTNYLDTPSTASFWTWPPSAA